MREDTFEMRERGCQMRHFRALAQDLAALSLRTSCSAAERRRGEREGSRRKKRGGGRAQKFARLSGSLRSLSPPCCWRAPSRFPQGGRRLRLGWSKRGGALSMPLGLPCCSYYYSVQSLYLSHFSCLQGGFSDAAGAKKKPRSSSRVAGGGGGAE